MKTNKFKEITKLTNFMEQVMSEPEDCLKDFNILTQQEVNMTTFLEFVLKFFERKTRDIVQYLECGTEEFDVLNVVNNTLDDVTKEKASVYHGTIIDDKGEHPYTTNRKGHIIEMLEWAHEYIVGNLEVA
ncbi:pathogenicity island protein [Staphylococcus haemolyticus]|uniref:pathogenicity island protein n=1 Tax=Staphylococcus haemolyticus TaxID=1283 RepID=UPI001F0B035D|nr:pathogenicity island protein [Staphylococcus haemolyticus]MCH4420258.1 pathogenicity island protein [Staphylococcus haemolyticus]MCH4460459.1 pathogenicity island protein [Staphylococcus haemolyticus]MCH4484214.1 pathogenicity island protein [Staphylococcus haemolyticus]MCH4532633.1 pathogenicity island protein [Staphylococcus haemolyticus]